MFGLIIIGAYYFDTITFFLKQSSFTNSTVNFILAYKVVDALIYTSIWRCIYH